ncbi:guanylate kinase [Cyclonatronum proteinivorum]|uniref:Guanylate kinase n=1 Tax=Cyclonatronum proteinivorum TaxID=1457365 RepID=A0A345UNY3_9BACT|nr:guanylate kinase [Cyclonatronum proteinivorum]AXJ02185.1 guanylate kinase [Cyclonatronum proteinivorum]
MLEKKPLNAGKGSVVVITAPSGAGKTTLAKKLLAEYDQLVFSVSATTRAPRANEVHGRDYHFLDRETFDQHIEQGDFLEWEEFYNGSRYGTLRSDVEHHIKNGYFVLFDVEVKGALNLKNVYGDACLSVFIKPPSTEVLESRLRSRGTESEETLRLRLDRAKMELQQAGHFDAIVVNDDFDLAYAAVKDLITQFTGCSY